MFYAEGLLKKAELNGFKVFFKWILTLQPCQGQASPDVLKYSNTQPLLVQGNPANCAAFKLHLTYILKTVMF